MNAQQTRIFRLLERHAPDWVPLPQVLALGISQYGARIKELRDAGHQIENKVEQCGKERHSWFRLVKVQDTLFP